MLGGSSRWLALRVLACFAMLAIQGVRLTSAQTPAANDESPGLVDDGEYVSPQFDLGITWTDDWEVADPDDDIVDHAIGGNFDGPIASDPASGDIVFLTDVALHSSVLSLSFVNISPATAEDANAALENPDFLTQNLFLEEGATQELLETNDTSSMILGRDAAPNTDHFSYIAQTVEPDAGGLMFWVGLDVYDPAAYENVLTSMGDIDVEGYDLFPAVPADDLLTAMQQPAGTQDSASTPTASEDENKTSAPSAAKDVSPNTADASPEATDGEENPGLLSDSEYESPQYGIGITWNDAWAPYDAGNGMTVSDEDSGYDGLYLTDQPDGFSVLYFTIESNPDNAEAADLKEVFADPDYLTDVLKLSADTEVLLSDVSGDAVSVVLYDTETYDDPVLLILEARFLEGGDVVAYTDFRAYADDVDRSLLTSVTDDVRIDDEPALSVFTPREIINAIPE